MRWLLPLALVVSMAPFAPPSDGPRAELRGMIENVNPGRWPPYQATDSAGTRLDTAKIIQDATGQLPRGVPTGHRWQSARQRRYLDHLLNWTWRHTSVPVVRSHDHRRRHGFVVAWEQESSTTWLSDTSPVAATYWAVWLSRSYDAPRTLSACAEGTPNIYSSAVARQSTTPPRTSGAHYTGTATETSTAGHVDQFRLMACLGSVQCGTTRCCTGVSVANIRRRDAVNYKGYKLRGVFEGRTPRALSARGARSSTTTRPATRTGQHPTPTAAARFRYPSFTSIHAPNGHWAVVVTAVPAQRGSAAGEAGELIYYRNLLKQASWTWHAVNHDRDPPYDCGNDGFEGVGLASRVGRGIPEPVCVDGHSTDSELDPTLYSGAGGIVPRAAGRSPSLR